MNNIHTVDSAMRVDELHGSRKPWLVGNSELGTFRTLVNWSITAG
jgi:hypothetical protein